MIYKLKSNRVQRTYVGGTRIDQFTGEALFGEGREYYPEDWTASVVTAMSGDKNSVPEGLGQTEENLLIKDIVGKDDFGIWVKLLDSDERLVIQAHPTVEFARRELNSPFGKTECWYFMDCTEDACVYLGFKQGVTRELWRKAIEEQNSEKLLSMLWKIPVKAGDFVFVDGGVPHAIGTGCFMIELQEPSDLMVVAEKYTPSGRQIPDYRMDMGMGLEKALEVYDYTTYSLEQIKAKYCPAKKKVAEGIYEILGTELTDKFSMYQLRGNAELTINSKYSVSIVTEGEGIMNGKSVKKGDRCFLKEEEKVHTTGAESFCVVICM